MQLPRLAAVLFFLLTPHVFANNSYFIPGDAFFYFEIDQAEWKDLQSGELKILAYDRPEHLSFTFCGYAGYKNLDISNLSPAFRKLLIDAVAEVKKSYPSKIIEVDHGKQEFLIGPSGIEKREINKIRVFVYHSSVDFANYRIGLKYNESWPETAVRMGFQKKHFRYDFFIASPQAITEEWMMGSDVPGLAVKMPNLGNAFIEEPLTFEPNDIQFLVCPPVELKDLCYPSRDKQYECVSVSSDSSTILTNDSSKSRKSIWQTRNR